MLTPTIQALPEKTTELEYQTIAGPEEYYLFFEAYGGDFEAFNRVVADDPTVSTWSSPTTARSWCTTAGASAGPRTGSSPRAASSSRSAGSSIFSRWLPLSGAWTSDSW